MSTFSIKYSGFEYSSANETHSIFNIEEGNLLIVCIAERSGGSYENLTVSDNNGKTWTYADDPLSVPDGDFYNNNYINDINARMAMRVGWRLVESDEDLDNLVIATSNAAGNGTSVILMEVAIPAGYTPAIATNGISFDGSGLQSDPLDGTPTTTGTLSDTDMLHLFFMQARQNTAINDMDVDEYTITTEYERTQDILGTNQFGRAAGVALSGQSGTSLTITPNISGDTTTIINSAEGIVGQVVFKNTSASSTVNATASVSGAATATAATIVDKAISATASGAATATATAIVDKAISATVSGAATTSLTATRIAELSLAISGVGTATATATVDKTTSATVSGAATATCTAALYVPAGDLVTWTTGATGSADFIGEVLDSGWTESNGSLTAAWGSFDYTGEKLTFAYNTGQGADPATSVTLAGKNVPRIETSVAGDFTADFMIGRSPLQYDRTDYAGYGFTLYNSAGNSSRWELYVIGTGAQAQVYTNVAGTAKGGSITWPDIARGYPTHLRLDRSGTAITFSCSFDGNTWSTIVSVDDAQTTALNADTLGVYGYQKNDSGNPFQAVIEHIHLNGVALPTLTAESNIVRTNVWSPVFNDASEITDHSIGGSTVTGASGILTMTESATVDSSSRFSAGLSTLSADCGVVYKYRVPSPHASLYAGVQLRSNSHLGVSLTEHYGPPIGVVAEIHATSDLQRFITINGDAPAQADGGYWNFIDGKNILSPDTTTWLWQRVETIGPFFRMRTWADGAQEPSTWDFEYIDGSIPDAGDFGIAWSKNQGSPASGTIEFTDLDVYEITASASGSDVDATATVSGAATATGDTIIDKATSATVNGAASVSATASRIAELSPSVSGAATATVTAIVDKAISATVSGAATVSATASRIAELTLNVTGTALASIATNVDIALTSSVSGIAVATATATLLAPGVGDAAATVSGSAIATATANVDSPASATVNGAATATSDATREAGIVVAVTGVGSVTDLNVLLDKAISANVIGAATATATATQLTPNIGNATATISGAATATGDTLVDKAISATISGAATATASASLVAPIYFDISADITGAATATSTAVVDYTVSAIVLGSATVDLTANKDISSTGSISGAATATAVAELRPPYYADISAAITGSASTNLSLNKDLSVSASVSGGSSTSINIGRVGIAVRALLEGSLRGTKLIMGSLRSETTDGSLRGTLLINGEVMATKFNLAEPYYYGEDFPIRVNAVNDDRTKKTTGSMTLYVSNESGGDIVSQVEGTNEGGGSWLFDVVALNLSTIPANAYVFIEIWDNDANQVQAYGRFLVKPSLL